MSTKVISSKVTPEEYDALLEACNIKGCTISQFVKDACLEKIGRKEEFSESQVADHKESSKLVSDLENKIVKLELELYNANSTISNHNRKITDLYDWLQIQGLRVDPISLNLRRNLSRIN